MISADRDSPEAVVRTLYSIISGPADAERDWARLASLFTSTARLRVQCTSPEGPAQSITWTPAEFAAQADEDYRRRSGFWEREIAGHTIRFGSIAHAWSVYESRQGSEDSAPFARGINSVQLVLEEDGWAIDHLLWDIEQPHNLISPEQLVSSLRA